MGEASTEMSTLEKWTRALGLVDVASGLLSSSATGDQAISVDTPK